ncbi:polyhydroxybutyrate depolymerase [Solimonas aquatica]|uniref:Polyhydroxybutyrate depolymerase n=1 Tax=Solimonas aquatica TaxID=489703 RepID=A0A1H9CZ66_9GAMM|nr:PHB depolymerase family esterase [Solimonas aquatica]SEQ06542.1 polyhydroxybutyrate depolymerase [Solimonas aquatica]
MSKSRLLTLPLFVAALILMGCLMSSPRAVAEGSGQVTERTLRIGGLDRTYLLYRPTSLPAGKPVPLVVALHGGVGTGKIMEDMTHFDNVADEHGFMVAYPDGIARAWNAGSCCAKPMQDNVDDVGFVRAVINDAKAIAPIDARRVYGTGFSNGSMLLHRIACEAPDTFTAIAAVSGGIMVQSCTPKRGIPALLIQGRADPRIPWDGGVFEGSFRPSIAQIVQSLGQRNQCSTQDDVVSEESGVQCRTLRGCASGDEVTWCGIAGAGHQWAGGRTFLPRFLGQNNDRWDASEKIWSFFSRYPKS